MRRTAPAFISRRTALRRGAGALAAAWSAAKLTAGCGRAPAATGRKTITFWQPFGGDVGDVMRHLRDVFERAHPSIRVEMSYAANDLNASQKLFLAIAGGCPPDVTMVDGQQLAEWAARGALTDITDHLERAGLRGQEAFWLPRWRESTFAGRAYALPWGADPNFAFLWNRDAFEKAALDPDRPPQTIEELDACHDALTKTDRRGRIVQIGIIPWRWDGDNSMFTWGYAFGGSFYEMPPDGSPRRIGRVTANHPRNVDALRWMATYARRFGVEKISAFVGNFPGLANNPFFLGYETMRLFHVTEMKWLHKYAPSLRYGIAPMPTALPLPPDGRRKPVGWIGGWSLAIPRGARGSAEAFEFIRWMCTSDEGTRALGEAMNQMPAYRHSVFYRRFEPGGDSPPDDPSRVFYEILKNSTHVRTLMPVQGYLMELLKRGVNRVLYESADPQAVLDEVTARTQKRLEHVMERVLMHLGPDGRRREGP